MDHVRVDRDVTSAGGHGRSLIGVDTRDFLSRHTGDMDPATRSELLSVPRFVEGDRVVANHATIADANMPDPATVQG